MTKGNNGFSLPADSDANRGVKAKVRGCKGPKPLTKAQASLMQRLRKGMKISAPIAGTWSVHPRGKNITGITRDVLEDSGELVWLAFKTPRKGIGYQYVVHKDFADLVAEEEVATGAKHTSTKSIVSYTKEIEDALSHDSDV